jgi:hypothetical protein
VHLEAHDVKRNAVNAIQHLRNEVSTVRFVLAEAKLTMAHNIHQSSPPTELMMTFLVTNRRETRTQPTVINTVFVASTDMRWPHEHVTYGIIGTLEEAMMKTAIRSD